MAPPAAPGGRRGRRCGYSDGMAAEPGIHQADTWANAHALVTLLATAAAVYVESTLAVLLVVPASFACLLLRRQFFPRRPPATRRYAHQLTLLRFLVLCYAAYRLDDIGRHLLLALFTANVLLDVLDGYVARRLDRATHFGMVFDREVDGFYVLVACLYFYLGGSVAAWILVPGLLPYAYRLLAWALGNPPCASRKVRHAAFLAGVNFVLLLVAVATSDDVRVLVLVIATAIVTLSFLVSFRDLLRYRNESGVLQQRSD